MDFAIQSYLPNMTSQPYIVAMSSNENRKRQRKLLCSSHFCSTVLVVLFLFTAASGLFAQDVNKQKLRTPDGVSGRLAFNLSTLYTTVSADDPSQQYDITRHRIQLSLPVGASLTLLSHFESHTADSTLFTVGGGLRFRLRNPIRSVSEVNPDGAIGAPIISVSMRTRFADNPDTGFESVYYASLLLPVSRHFSVEVAYNKTDRLLPDDIDGVAVSFSWYPRSYRSGNLYQNPDGSAGTPSIHLTGAGSSDRILTSLRFDMPLSDRMTPYLQTSYMKVNAPEWTGLAARIGISYYPFN